MFFKYEDVTMCDKSQPYVDTTVAFSSTWNFNTWEVLVMWAGKVRIRHKSLSPLNDHIQSHEREEKVKN